MSLNLGITWSLSGKAEEGVSSKVLHKKYFLII
jgi:hypothetical protein